jgi:hypothetical protein
VVDKVAILVDDMADTCGTLVKAAAVLKENGAKSVLALVTHGILSGNAIETLNSSVLEALVVTNTVPLGDKVERVSPRAAILPQSWLTSSILVSQDSRHRYQPHDCRSHPSYPQWRIRLLPLHSRSRLNGMASGRQPGSHWRHEWQGYLL